MGIAAPSLVARAEVAAHLAFDGSPAAVQRPDPLLPRLDTFVAGRSTARPRVMRVTLMA